jgi:hypothetical protein
MTNRDQEIAHQRTMENERHKLELENSELNRKVSERNALLEAIENFKREISVLQERTKVPRNYLLKGGDVLTPPLLSRSWSLTFNVESNRS